MPEPQNRNIQWHQGFLHRGERWGNLSTRGATVWFTGLSASGKSTIAAALEYLLVLHGVNAYRLDGDNIRHGLNSNLGFSRQDRAENIRRIGEVSKLFADSGCICLTAFISPYVSDRERVRDIHRMSDLQFFEVFVDAPLDVCERRDPKGMYAKARKGQIRGFTGIDDPYEPPALPDLILRTAHESVQDSVATVLDMLITFDLVPDLGLAGLEKVGKFWSATAEAEE